MPPRPFRAYTGNDPYVFVCYAHNDSGVVYKELGELAAAGTPIWYDEGIEPSAIWADSLAHAIENCGLFLYYLSPRSARSEHCRREVSFALDLGLKMLVTVLEPTELSAGLKLLLGNRQAIQRFELSPEVYRDKLHGAINSALTETALVKPPSSKTPARKISGERRLLTVLYADIVLGAQGTWPDSEDWADCVSAFKSLCDSSVMGYEARIAQHTGDGVVAYFGHPVAHENDAERAVRCAMELRANFPEMVAKLGSDSELHPRLRIAVNSGPVVIEPSTFLTSGPTPNLAARMLELNILDSVLVSSSTLHLVRSRFDAEPLGEQHLAGFAEPVAVHAVTRSLSGTQIHVAPDTPFVGRQLELAQLTALLSRTRAGTAMFGLIQGEPGIGKSRLIHEFSLQLQSLTHHWRTMQCSPFDARSPFHAITASLSDSLGLEGANGSEERSHLFNTGVQRWGVNDPRHLAALAELLAVQPGTDLPAIATLQRRLTIEALARALVSPSTLTILHVEDVHWLDPSSLEVIEHLLANVHSAPLLVLMTSRPDFEPPASWRGRVTPVNVERLLDADVRELIDAIAPAETAVAELAARCDGIPLFAEALAQNIGKSSAESVPQTLQELLYHELDQLGEARYTAQVAAVLGREFEPALIAQVLGMDAADLEKHLAALVESGLVYRGSSGSYVFKHALVQELAYDSMLKRARRDFHRQIAVLLEEHHLTTTGPHVLATHFSGAREHARAAAYWSDAGRAAFRRSAHVEAASYLRQGLAEISGIEDEAARDEQEITLQIYLGETLSVLQGYAAKSTQQAFERARAVSVARDRTDVAFRAISGLQGVALVQSHIDHAQALASELQALAASMNDPKAKADANTHSGITAYRAGCFQQAGEHFAAAIDYHRQEHERGKFGSVAAHADAYQINTLWLLGRPDSAVAQAEAALARARSTKHAFNEAAVLTCFGATRIFRGEAALSLQVAADLGALAEEHGFLLHKGNAQCLRGMSLALGDDLDEAIAELVAGIESFHQVGQGTYATFYRSFLAAAHIRRRELDKAEAIVTETLALDSEVGVMVSTAELLRLRAMLCKEAGARDEALELLQQVLTLCDEQCAQGPALRTAITRYQLFPETVGTREDLQTRFASFAEGLDTRDLVDAAALLN